MRRLGTLVIALLLATAAAAGAGDNIKWCKSKKITYYAPSTDPSKLGDRPRSIKSKYLLQWSPYFSNDVDDILVRWLSWEWTATGLNHAFKNSGMVREAYEKRVAEERFLLNKFLIFEVWVEAKNAGFYELADEDYWEFILLTEGGDLEPFDVSREGSLDGKGVRLGVGGERRDVLDYGLILMNKFTVRFENPYRDAAPERLRLLIRSEKYTRGFEWRFKEE